MTDAADLIYVTFGGRTFRCSRRTAAHLEFTDDRLQRRNPGAAISVIQGSYNTGVSASAGTHDFDAVLDVQIVGLEWKEACQFLRQCGWAAWVREPPLFGWHIHMISLGYPGQVGALVPEQVSDYYAHRDGLASHAADNTWHPRDIDATVFNYDEWAWDEMATEEQLTRLLHTEVVAPLRDSIRKYVGGVRELVKANHRQVTAALEEARDGIDDAATKTRLNHAIQLIKDLDATVDATTEENA